MRRGRYRIGFGIHCKAPSWQWIGLGMLSELDKYFETSVYDPKVNEHFDALILIKKKPPLDKIQKLVEQGTRIIYCPVDAYHSENEIAGDAAFLSLCSMLLLHSETLRPFLSPYCRHIRLIEHHNKFGLAHSVSYKDDGFILWVGGFENIPYLLKWHSKASLKHPLIALTNSENSAAHKVASQRTLHLGIPLDVNENRVNGIQMLNWSERLQQELLSQAKAAIDIKGTLEFNQITKPPTKSQKYIASGIPFAINKEAYAIEYFSQLGFDIATPEDTDRWFSREYWQETRNFCENFKKRISIESVGQTFKQCIEETLSTSELSSLQP